jgi:CRP-like cAMP-binding protein
LPEPPKSGETLHQSLSWCPGQQKEFLPGFLLWQGMPVADYPNPHRNLLLATLRHVDYVRLQPHLEHVEFAYRQVLYPANKPIQFVYFFETGVGSLVNTMRNGDASEVGAIGNEGIVGLPVVLGDKTGAYERLCSGSGAQGFRMKSRVFSDAMQESATIRRLMFHYAHAFFNQVAQSAACAHHHVLEQRCCRWLLMTHDRMQSDDFTLTQEFLAMMLGIRSRPGVTKAASVLQRAGLIRYKHGHVTILDVTTSARKNLIVCWVRGEHAAQVLLLRLAFAPRASSG